MSTLVACRALSEETEEERLRLDQEAREGMEEYMKLIQENQEVKHQICSSKVHIKIGSILS